MIDTWLRIYGCTKCTDTVQGFDSKRGERKRERDKRQKNNNKIENFVFLLDRCSYSLFPSGAVGKRKGKRLGCRSSCVACIRTYIPTCEYFFFWCWLHMHTCNCKPLAKGFVHKISLSLTLHIRDHLGVYFCLLLSILYVGSRPDLSSNESPSKFKAASLFFRAHTFLILTGKMPFSQRFPFQNPLLSSMNLIFPSAVVLLLLS